MNIITAINEYLNYLRPTSESRINILIQLWFDCLGSMLQVNPDSRPHVEDIHAELVALASDKDINLKAPIVVSNRNFSNNQQAMVELFFGIP